MTATLPFTVESCVETVDQAVFAQAHGADQLELCASLEYDGLTPGDALISEVLQAVDIPVKVMIRHRPGDFVYDRKDFELLMVDLERVKESKVSGIVFGANRGRDLDYDLISRIASATALPITIHKAIDLVGDQVAAIEKLIEMSGIDSVLSSGGSGTAIEGAKTLRQMVETADCKLNIIAAGSITTLNRLKVYHMTSVPVLHGKKIVG